MIWESCLERLKEELPSGQFNTWIRPLQPIEKSSFLCLLAPNRYVRDEILQNFLPHIQKIIQDLEKGSDWRIEVELGNSKEPEEEAETLPYLHEKTPREKRFRWKMPTNLNPDYTFERFIETKTNQIARAASIQIAKSLEQDYNPLFICGRSGLGKTHLTQAIGQSVLRESPERKLAYLNSERFVSNMVQALQQNHINRFQAYFRSLDVLLIDDIQFFAGKERSQEEFFHTFNSLLSTQCRIVLTCDRYPKEVEGLEYRLKSRFGWGLTVAIDPPDLESRVAILKSKIRFKRNRTQINVPDDVCFFIARNFPSNVRELEGALNRLIAYAEFTNNEINKETCKEALKDLLLVAERQISMECIQKTVADYFNIRISELLAKRRSRSVVRPRQIAMSLTKALTNHSLPEIGEAFGRRDHTTVLHATRKISELRENDSRIADDYNNLVRKLTC